MLEVRLKSTPEILAVSTRMQKDIAKEMFQRTVFAINVPNQFLNLSSKLLVYLQVGATWNGHLHQHNPANLVWMLLEKLIQGLKLLWYALNVVKPVDANHDFHAPEILSSGPYHFLNINVVQTLVKVGWLNSDWQGFDQNFTVFDLELVITRAQIPYIVRRAFSDGA
jgi:hypothetical protein